ncbi:unnamed protein product [Durusdinium trenchii]|uniref:Uncharacterized protein n=1 Tax=Durusdinium trenchii TaxID=1381693 RepID=A0ABP0QXL7_9DINO
MATVNAQNEDVANLASATFVTGPRAGEHCRALTTTQVSRLALASGRCALRSVTWASLHEAARRMSDLRGALQPFELAHLTFGAPRQLGQATSEYCAGAQRCIPAALAGGFFNLCWKFFFAFPGPPRTAHGLLPG